MNYIAIDIGASFIKGALLDLDKLTVSSITKRPSPGIIRDKFQLKAEVNIKYYEKIVRVILSELLDSVDSVYGIVFSSQMHGMVLVDAKINPITPFISWQDERLQAKASENQTWQERLEKKLSKINTRESGIKLRSGIMGATLFWLKQNNLIKKNNSRALFLGDYIAARLTNGLSVVHSTNACGSGLFNVSKNQWDKKIILTLGLDINILPKVVETGFSVGEYKHRNKEIPIYVSVGDMQAALLGCLLKDGDYCINIGTGSQISVISKKFKTGEFDVRSYFDNKFLLTKTHIPAGRGLNVIIKLVEDIGEKIYGGKKDVWEALIGLSSKIKTTQGLAVSTSFFKNNATGINAGGISNITESNLTIENIFLAALEDMVKNYLTFFKAIGGKTGKRIVLSGGIVRKIPVIIHLIKKNFPKSKIELAENEEETLTGLFILSLIIHGKSKDTKSASSFILKNKLKFQ